MLISLIDKLPSKTITSVKKVLLLNGGLVSLESVPGVYTEYNSGQTTKRGPAESGHSLPM